MVSPRTPPAAAEYNLDQKTWTEIEINRNGPKHGSNYEIFTDGERIFAFGGGSDGFPLHVFDPVKKKWKIGQFQDNDAPVRKFSQNVWTGESLLQIGGYMIQGPALKKGFGNMIEP